MYKVMTTRKLIYNRTDTESGEENPKLFDNEEADTPFSPFVVSAPLNLLPLAREEAGCDRVGQAFV